MFLEIPSLEIPANYGPAARPLTFRKFKPLDAPSDRRLLAHAISGAYPGGLPNGFGSIRTGDPLSNRVPIPPHLSCFPCSIGAFGAQLPDELYEEARLKRLVLWRQSRQRMAEAVSLAEILRSAGIESVFLKGTALAVQSTIPMQACAGWATWTLWYPSSRYRLR